MLKAISLIAALIPFVLVGYFLLKLKEVKAREPSTTEPPIWPEFIKAVTMRKPPTRQYELLQRYGYPSFVVIFSCIVLLGYLQPKWIERIYFEPFLGFSLYLCVSSRTKSAIMYFLLFAISAVVSCIVTAFIEKYNFFQIITLFQNNKNFFLHAGYYTTIMLITLFTIRFALFRNFTISLVQIFISAIAMFFLMLVIWLPLWLLAVGAGLASY